mgnify:CR=1 FL=1
MDKVTMSVQEMAMQMGISLSKAYALTREADFPIVRVGKRVLVPVSEILRCGYRQEPRRNDTSENKRGKEEHRMYEKLPGTVEKKTDGSVCGNMKKETDA